MTLDVTGVETIEITDPKGVCNPPAPAGVIGVPGLPYPQPSQPYIPSIPGLPLPSQPYPSPSGLGNWSKAWRHRLADDNVKWGVGLPEGTEPKKWAENWQSGMSPEQQQEAFDHGYTAITQ